MKRFLHTFYAATLLLPILTSAHASDKQPAANLVKERLTLRFVKPTAFISLLADNETVIKGSLIPDAIAAIEPDDAANILTVTGTHKSIDELKTILRFFDIQARRVRLNVRLVRVSTEGIVPLTSAVVEAENNRQSSVTAIGNGHLYRIAITIHVNGDGSSTVAVVDTVQHRTGIVPKNQSGYFGWGKKTNFHAAQSDTLKLEPGIYWEVTPTEIAPAEPLAKR